MALNEEEKSIVDFGLKTGKTKEQVLSALAKYRKTLVEQEPPSGFLAAVRDIPSDIGEVFTGAREAVTRGFERADEAATQAVDMDSGVSPLAATIKTIGAGLRAGAEVVGEGVLGAAKLFTSPATEKKVSGAVELGAQKLVETDTVQDLITKYEGLNPQQKATVDGLLGTAEGLTTMFGVGPATRAIRTGISTPLKSASTALTSTFKQSGNLVEKITPESVRVFHKRFLKPQDRESAIKILATSYEEGLMVNRQAVSNNLEKLAVKASFGDTKVTKQDLARNLAEEGYVPHVEGKLADFSSTFDDIGTRQTRLMESLDPVLANVPTQTTVDSLENQVKGILRQSPQIVETLDKSLSETTRFFASIRDKYGDNLSAVQINEIRKAMNQRTRAFSREAFEQDTANAAGSVMRRRLDEIVPDDLVREANKEWARLNNLELTARVFHNQQIDVGFVGRAFGSYAGTLIASGVGLSVAGPGGLVVAGLAARYGGDAVAQMLRNKKFSQELKDLIVQEIRKDDVLVQKLIEQAEKENKAILERLLLPEPAIRQPAAGQSAPSTVRSVPAKIGETGRDTKTGRFFRTFLSS